MLSDNFIQLEDDEGQVPLWDFSPKDYVEAWREAVKSLGLDHVCSTPYQARHGGPLRDLQSKLRTEAEVAARGWWKSGSSVRNYAKPSRMNKVAQSAGSRILEYGEHVRNHFAPAILGGTVFFWWPECSDYVYAGRGMCGEAQHGVYREHVRWTQLTLFVRWSWTLLRCHR